MSAFDPRPVTLTGRNVRIEPLQAGHAAGLLAAAAEPSIWRYLPRLQPRTLPDMRAWIEEALAETRAGRQVAFAIIDAASGGAVGSTRYLEIRREHRGLEIGWTWLAATAQRTAINTECKYLLLAHAFDDLGALRVQLKTDGRNVRSQAAIERIGGVREGVLRRHMIMPDGHVRDTVCFSVTDAEWPGVKRSLAANLQRAG
jgi:RimJ/RimL family protein N-acetyltransferase